MGVFDDIKLEKLDWMSQITETIESELNIVLAKLPDRVPIDRNLIDKLIDDGYSMSFSTRTLVRYLLNEVRRVNKISWDDERLLVNCFKFECNGDIIIDYENQTLTGDLALVKVTHTFDDAELQKLMGANGLEYLRNFRSFTNVPLDRINEILDVLGGCEAEMKNRSHKKKLQKIYHRTKEIFVNNEWRIRDVALADKVCHWMRDYIQDGNLAAFTNFCKLKVMTHSNMPIYSIKEEIL